MTQRVKGNARMSGYYKHIDTPCHLNQKFSLTRRVSMFIIT
jgi:hypothetical protein